MNRQPVAASAWDARRAGCVSPHVGCDRREHQIAGGIRCGAAAVPEHWFDADSTGGARDAIGRDHEKKDDVRGIGLEPAHDWSSNAADAFGLMCVAYEEPMAKRRIRYSNRAIV